MQLEYRGPVENTLQEVLGSVRSACTYVGARTLQEITEQTSEDDNRKIGVKPGNSQPPSSVMSKNNFSPVIAALREIGGMP